MASPAALPEPPPPVAAAAEQVEQEVGDYRHGENVPVGTYAALTAGYLAATGAAVVAFRRSGRRLPARIPPGDVVLLGVATAKLSRLISRDKVTSWSRAPFVSYRGPASASEVEEAPRGDGVRRGIGELLACPWCVGQWVGTAFGAAYALAPVATRYGAGLLASLTVADAVQHATAAVNRASG